MLSEILGIFLYENKSPEFTYDIFDISIKLEGI